MNNPLSKTRLLVGLLTAATGCFQASSADDTDDTGTSSAAESGSTSGAATTFDAPSTSSTPSTTDGDPPPGSTAADSETSAADSTGEGEGEGEGESSGTTGEGESSGTTGETNVSPVTVSGRVRTGGLLTSPGLPDAEVALFDDPTVSATADANGDFDLVGVPPNATAHILTTHPDYAPGINALDVAETDVAPFGVPMISTSLVEGSMVFFPDYDPTLGSVFFVSSHTDTTTDALSGGISVIQPGLHYANDPDGINIDVNVTLLPEYPVVGVLNVPPTPAGALTVIATHPTLTCDVATAMTPPIVAGHFTTVNILCE